MNETVDKEIERLFVAGTALSDSIFDQPELAFEEQFASAVQSEFLAGEDFTVSTAVGGLPTAIMGEWSSGKGGPTIAFLGEFDALPDMGQEPGVSFRRKGRADGKGHGCGHHLLGVGSMLAAITVRNIVRDAGLAATVRYYGCPAEEGGSGKSFMLRAGGFDGIDAALSWHPSDANFTFFGSWTASAHIYFRFHGRSAHAAFNPSGGRSALDAVELMNVGANYLREHLPRGSLLHYAIVNSGGPYPNVVQDFAEVAYTLRTVDTGKLGEVVARIRDVAAGAALMTGTTLDVEFDAASSALLPNRTLAEVMQAQLERNGGPAFSAEDMDFAREIRRSLPRAAGDREPQDDGAPLANQIRPLDQEIFLPVSGDIGDVSWLVPTIQCFTACWAVGTEAHTWQAVAQGKLHSAHSGMALAAKVMAGTALKLIEEPAVIDAAREELIRRTGGKYTSPIPDEVIPRMFRQRDTYVS